MPTAAPSDVRVEVDTNLTDDDLADILSLVANEIDRAYDDTDVEFDSNQHRADFEAALAALRVVTGRDREVAIERRGQVRVDYGTSQIASLRARVSRLDPGDAFTRAGGVTRNTGRYAQSVTRRGDE